MPILFVVLIVATTLVAIAVWCFVAHTLCVITEDTAAGNDEVVWSDEPMVDWLWQAIYVAWQVGVWVAPALLISRLATGNVDERWRPYACALLGFAVFWCTFPLSLLSSMSAESRMTIFHPALFQRLAKRPGDVVKFYLLSGIIVAICVALVPWTFVGDGYASIVVGGLGLGLAIVLYSRLLGRLACVARLTKVKDRDPKKPKRVKSNASDPWEVPDDVRKEQEARGAGFVQPSEMDGLQSPHEGEVTGYDVNFDQRNEIQKIAEHHMLEHIDLDEKRLPRKVIALVPETVARKHRVIPLSLDGNVLRIATSEPDNYDRLQKLQVILKRDIQPVLADRDQILVAINRHYRTGTTESDDSLQMTEDVEVDQRIENEMSQARKNAAAIKPDQVEMMRAKRRKEKIPERPWSSGILSFPLQPAVAVQWIILSLGLGLFAVMVRALQALWPF